MRNSPRSPVEGGARRGMPLPLPWKGLRGDRGRVGARGAPRLRGHSWATPGLPARLPRDGTWGQTTCDIGVNPSRRPWCCNATLVARGLTPALQPQARTTRGVPGRLASSAWIGAPASPGPRRRAVAATFDRAWTWRLGMPAPFAYSGAAPEARGGDCAEGAGGADSADLPSCSALPARCETTGSHFTTCDPAGGACCWGSSPCWP